ncbi:MAG: DUF3099 domain-containing protein [Nesterenkonia sp.]|uniref:DUF3099 domain-containing protein n=1 Tax=Nesterenkonia marinintestina TaxID=2979865 RepID=UPI0021C19EC4|nr:DUF3099 domain-containing protein [Nesterenkonia sp. GX14115]MDO5492521.1 DUF3099 domain-containing protein [Nesterenkonia sp.]
MNDPVHSITDAPERHSDEQTRRMVRYAAAMGIRIVCFVLAVLLQNWMSWVLLAAAVILPYVAVVAANAGGDRYARTRDADTYDDGPSLLTAGGQEDEALDRQWWEDEERDERQDSGAEADPHTVIPGLLDDDDPEEDLSAERRTGGG